MPKKIIRNYIALEDVDLDWSEAELIRFERMWNSGKSLKEMCESLKRTQLSMAAIILDRAEKGFIEPRSGGLFYGENLLEKEADAS